MADNSIPGPSCGSKDPYDRRPYNPTSPVDSCLVSTRSHLTHCLSLSLSLSLSLPPSLFGKPAGNKRPVTGPNEVIEGNHAD